jgi:NAD-dependent deacetylase
MSKVVILSGAGISAESGISTFRDSDGLWDNYDVKIICNYDSLDRYEDETIEFYDKRRLELKDKKPNHAHKVVSELKKLFPNDIAVITQNIDDLFEKSGLKEDEVIHLHGFTTQLRCRDSFCDTIIDIGYTKQNDNNNGICPTCGGKLRPNIVFFGEQAPMYEKLNEEFNDCEMFVVIGTSGNVIGVNSMANFCDISILNNLEPSPVIEDNLFSKVIYDKATNAIDIIAKDIKKFLNS